MSGGSYNYLCEALMFGVGDVFSKLHDLESMVDDMKELKPEVVPPLEKLLKYIRDVEEKVKKSFYGLSPLMRAIEWWQSGDWGEEDVDVALNTLKKKLREGDEGD